MTAALKVLYDVVSAFDNKQDCVSLFIDLSKAFDTFDHQILLKCLESIGFYEKCNWFANYLANLVNYLSCRAQAVVADGFMSVNKGVPHGSILGPLLVIFLPNSFIKYK